MKKDIFSTWLKEFCSLVFIQTIQAFIFAIVMSLIISVMTPNNVAGVERSDVIAGTGMIAVVALASISKIEDLVKKIFGVQSSVTDPSMRGGLKSLATTMLAANFAKRAFDNVGKVTGGVSGVINSNRQMAQEKARFARDMHNKVGGNTGLIGGNTGSDGSGQNQLYGGGSTDQGLYSGGAGTAGAIAGGLNGIAGQSPRQQQEALNKMRDKFEDRMAELKKTRRESSWKAVSGIAETPLAIGGALGGSVLGAATGDVDKILQYGGAGMGAGDLVGENITKAISSSQNAVNMVRAQRSTMREFNSAMQNVNSSSRDAINAKRNIITKYNEAKRQWQDLEKDNFDAGNFE